MTDVVRALMGFGVKTRIVPQSDYQGFTLLDSTEQLEIDCTLRFGIVHSGEVTENPVEEGADRADHVVDRPDSISMDVILSNDPLDDPIPGRPALDPFRADDAYQKLLGWKLDKQLLAIVTPSRAFESFILHDIAPTWDARTGRCVRATLTFRELIVVQTETAALTQGGAQGSMAPKKKSGSKKMKTATPAQRASALAYLKAWITG